MKKTYLIVVLLLISLVTTLTGCSDLLSKLTGNNDKPEVDGSFVFVIYESDSDNSNLSDNKVVARYTIEYNDCQTVTDTLIEKDGKYYLSENSLDYIILKDSGYGLTYTEGYFANYSECSNGAIDVSWSYTAVNGAMASFGIGETPLDGLEEYGFVINGWK